MVSEPQQDRTPDVLISHIKQLQLDHPDLSLREILKIVFNQEDFNEGGIITSNSFSSGENDTEEMIIPLSDFTKDVDLIEDSFNELLTWVKSNTGASGDEEAQQIAFAIINSRKKKQKKTSEKKTKEEKEKSWFDEWQEVAEIFEKRRKVRGEPTAKEKVLEKVKQLKIKEGSPKKEILERAKTLNTKDKLYEEIFKETQKSKNEIGYILSENKKIKIEGKGSEINPWDVRKIVKSLEGSYEFIHSHPSNNPFSSEDIANFILTSKMRKMGVISSEGYIYEVEKPKDLEKYSFNDITKAKERYKTAVIKARRLGNKEKAIDQIFDEFGKKYNLRFTKRRIKEDLIEDAESKKVGRPRKRGLRTGTPSALVGGAKTTTEGQELKARGIPLAVGNVNIEPIGALQPQPLLRPLPKLETPKFSIPFNIYNSETGEVILGQQVENLMGSERQMRPVSSSNVKSVGQLNNELLVQFLKGQGTYRYQFESPEMASEAYVSLTESGSPGRWIWQNIRGHIGGTPVTPQKIGPSLINRVPTIGGTTASLVEYKLAGRTPVSRVAGFEEVSKKVRRLTSNPTTNPNTGSRIEGELAGRLFSRNLGKNVARISQLRSTLPKLDFDDNNMKIKAKWKYVGQVEDVFKKEYVEDFIDLDEFKEIKCDSSEDFSILRGPITRSGAFEYVRDGKKVTLYKDWNSIKESFKGKKYLPVRGTVDLGSHHANEIGFAYNFEINDEKEQVIADIVSIKDLDQITNLLKPKEGYHVSLGFEDEVIGDVQYVRDPDHVAWSLENKEIGRCATGGGVPCTIKEVA